MNSPEREEVSRQLAKEFVYAIDDEGDWYRCPLSESRRGCVPKGIRDALISREMRIRELEATLASIVECQVEDLDGCGACVDAARLALNSKGEKG